MLLSLGSDDLFHKHRSFVPGFWSIAHHYGLENEKNLKYEIIYANYIYFVDLLLIINPQKSQKAFTKVSSETFF